MPTSQASGKDVPLKTSLLEPGMDSPIKVQGQFQMSSRSQVSTDNLLVLHFILQSLDGTGSPAHLLSQYMQRFICPSNVIYEEMVFNMCTNEQVINHGCAVNDMAKCLLPMMLNVWSYSSPTILMMSAETSLSHQVYAPL